MTGGHLHNFFDLKSANRGEIPIKRYFEMDVTYLYCKVPKVGYLLNKDPKVLIDTRKKTKLPGIIAWNLVKLVYQEFIKICC